MLVLIDPRTARSWLRLLVAGLPLVAFSAALGAAPPSDAEAENRRCLECHGQPHLAQLTPIERRDMVAAMPEGHEDATPPPAVRPGIYVELDSLVGSVHEGLRCIDCHADAEALPHVRVLAQPACGDQCHVRAQADYEHSAHAEALANGASDAPTCLTCHGVHDILRAKDRDALTHPFNAVTICGNCHKQHAAPASNGDSAEQHIQSYLDSVHGKAISGGGHPFAATCSDCHGNHEVIPSDDPRSATSRENIPATCGGCHLGVAEIYQTSIHGQLLADGDERAPVCTDCHAGHQITHASIPGLFREVVAECGECHDRPEMRKGRRSSFYKTYLASYHGQVNQLGSTRAARCSDCHGAHDILPMDDEASRLHGDHLVDTCATCHEGANARFAQFDPHADYRDRDRYPVLYGVWWYFLIVMSSAFGFFGLHSILWFVRSLIERVRNGPAPRHTIETHGIRRFTRVNRVNHAIVIITFFGLTLTGIPLLFAHKEWAHKLAGVIGGVEAAGLWHRTFAIMLICNFAVHFYSLFMAFKNRQRPFRRWLFGPRGMMPRWKDVTDCTGMIHWFIKGGKKPTFDRWTYWEKFDYWAEIGGTGIIGGSGLLLWFPEFFSKFLPGEAYNIAMIVHGYEALLALGFIFTIHFFNAHLRLEKFPVDNVIFTGQLPEEEFKEERGDEYARLLERGELDDYRVPPAPEYQHKLAVAVGIAAMAIGVTLVVLIILAGLDAL